MNIKLLSQVCKVPGAPGFEQPIRAFIKKQLKGLADKVYTDAMGNLIALKKGTKRKKLMVAAHMDEISFVVTHIEEDGYLRFHTLGGFDPKTLTAQRVIIHGKKDIIGVMGCKPIHIMTPEERNRVTKTNEYFIDTGLSKKEVEKLISIGDPVTRERELIEMGDNVNAKSLDNRVSVFILIEALKALKSKKVPYDFYAVFTVQEEVGLRGAIAASSGINPDFGINLDVTLANDMPGIAPHEFCTKLGSGTAIKVLDGRTICDYRMVAFMKSVAKKKKIKTQLEVLTAGGTDTAALQRDSNGGSIAGGISIPCRYLHQVIEMVNKNDVQATIDLLVACTLEMDKYNWSFR